MWIKVLKFIIGLLAEEKVKSLVKETIKEKITSKTKTSYDDKAVDLLFDATSTEDLARKAIDYGATTLKDAIGDGIRNSDVANFLDTAVLSKHNNIKRASTYVINNIEFDSIKEEK